MKMAQARAMIDRARSRGDYAIDRRTGGRRSLALAFIVLCLATDLLVELLLDALGVGNIEHRAQLNVRHAALAIAPAFGLLSVAWAIRASEPSARTALRRIVARASIVHDLRSLAIAGCTATLAVQSFVHVDDAQTLAQTILAVVMALVVGTVAALAVHLTFERLPSLRLPLATLRRIVPLLSAAELLRGDDFRRRIAPLRRRAFTRPLAKRAPPESLRPASRRTLSHSHRQTAESHEPFTSNLSRLPRRRLGARLGRICPGHGARRSRGDRRAKARRQSRANLAQFGCETVELSGRGACAWRRSAA